ncbi:lasso peptide biosynthesis B2 protein [Sphingopyxis sp. FD7]|jgi:hypothetical protein|uniref:lasso peptide biosynthesis B2 protein n=1 Tax=Sphingopyxis sp. FD7 TaxID=1914525 RepID=UPI000DC637F3|nr:lasso peptide biosynthesis B2 protein [Sphingopyxis sp. FD7]BBB14052.1 hypothetical protein SPYCA_3310 [Sphingopyxis sp. FD7]
MGWQLAPGTGFCEAGGELVFLDLTRDKYLAMRGEDRAAFDRLRIGEANDSDAMTRLVATGFITRSDRPGTIEPTQINVPCRDLASEPDPGFSPLMALAAARSLSWARRAMRPGHIAATIAALAREKAALSSDSGTAADLAGRYAACRWIVPIAPRCLIDALALDRILLARGQHAALVFGVRLAPFAAHCWLQTKDCVLTGTAADANNYTPILAVR